MIWDLLSEKEKSEVLLKLLIHFSKCDNEIHQDEFMYLVYICKNQNLDTELIRQYTSSDQNINEILPENEHDRMNILYHLLFIVNADHDIKPEEERMIYNFSFKLGFHENMTREFLSLMKMHRIQELPITSMIEIIKKYRN